MTVTEISQDLTPPLSKHLKAVTGETHERLDKEIMAARPFDTLESYGRFLRMQFVLHRDVSGLYKLSALQAVIPGLAALPRLAAVEGDIADLGIAAPDYPRLDLSSDPAGALGWLYVIEGSNLGAAFLYKAALGLGLSDTCGARHLAAAPEGRAEHWRRFTQALDAAPLDEDGRRQAAAGAEAAFTRARALADHFLG